MRKMKNNAGFSLVELIVVIAIMAILAGVGVAGYSIYTTESKKGVDRDLVAKIVHSIDIAYKSGMISDEEAVGVIIIDDNGVSVYEGNNAEGVPNTALITAITNTMGSDLSSLKLAYEKWGSGNIPTFAGNASALWNKVDTVSDKIMDFVESNATASAINPYGSTGDDLLAGVSYDISNSVSLNDFVSAWETPDGFDSFKTLIDAGGDTVTNGGDALNGVPIRASAAYFACVYARNHSVAEYVKTALTEKVNSTALADNMKTAALTQIDNIYSALSELANGQLASVVGNYVAATPANFSAYGGNGITAATAVRNILNRATNASELDLGTDGVDMVGKLINKYYASANSQNDATAFYQVFLNLAENSGVSEIGGQFTNNNPTLIEDYQGYMDNLEVAFNNASANLSGDNGIVIMVMNAMDGATLNYVVLPSEAYNKK